MVSIAPSVLRQATSSLKTHVTLFLCGDVMLGRGIDQIFPNPSNPILFEPCVDSALGYVQLAEDASGLIPRGVNLDYVWGDSLCEFERINPDARIVNLETAVTKSDDAWPKGINYRMHPLNVPCLTAAKIDCCILANNHVLDWGYEGLKETLTTLQYAGLQTAGAGLCKLEAEAPAAVSLRDGGRLLVFAYGCEDSGVDSSWMATEFRPGVNLLSSLSAAVAEKVSRTVLAAREPGDLVVISLHWGSNWGYHVSSAQRAFAKALINSGAADVIYGHSSHHPKGIEVHHGKLILYGCGDFINDYEGISGHAGFRGDLTLMYFPSLDLQTGRLVRLELVPMQMHRFRLRRPIEKDIRWMEMLLTREGERLGSGVEREGPRMSLRWSSVD